MDDASLAYTNAILHADTADADRLGAMLDVATTLEQAQRNHPGRIRHAAHIYANLGIPVFPIIPRGKRPLTAHGFKDATVDHAQIDAWWDATPDANLAYPTGILFDVVDIDGPTGLAQLYNGEEAVIDSLTVLGVALTSRDAGRHIYIPPTGEGNGTSWWPQVDYRGLGGYVVAPPSIGGNGRRYEWVRHLELTAKQAVA